LADMSALIEDWRASFETYGGSHHNYVWLLVAEATAAYLTRRGNDALGPFHPHQGAGPQRGGHHPQPENRGGRAAIALPRGRTSEADGLLKRALDQAERAGDPQLVVPVRCDLARMLSEEGRAAEALAQFDEMLAVGEPLFATLCGSCSLPDFAWLGLDLDR